MSRIYLKTLKIDSRLCIPCYVDSEISPFSIPGYVVLTISQPQFQTLSDSRLFPIPDYVFHAMSMVKSPIFRFQTMSSFQFQVIVFQTMYNLVTFAHTCTMHRTHKHTYSSEYQSMTKRVWCMTLNKNFNLV
jgi:hypothetical protein